MAQEEVQLSRGSKATMPNNKVPGRILIATDTGEAYVDDTSTSRVQIQDTTKLSKSGDTMSGPLNLGNNKITNVATGSSDSDVANVGQMHQYVDNEITNNQYSGTNPINVDNGGHTISHAAIGTAGSVGPTANVSPAHGGTFQVPQITTDVTGHVSSKSSRTITLPAAPTTISGNAGTATKLQNARTLDGVSFNGSANVTHYGTCSTAAATAAKVVACAGFTKATGARIVVKFTVTNTASSPTLNVNSTGASPIYYHGAAMPASVLGANKVYEFVFTGTNYELVGDRDTNTVYTAGTGISISSNTIGHSNSVSASNAGPSSTSTLSPGGKVSVPYVAYNAQGHITSSANRTITLNSNILDTGDIISALASASNNTTVLGAKVVADAINNLTSSINTLTKKLQNITATNGTTNVSGILDVEELRIGDMKLTYDEKNNQISIEPIS